MADMELKAHFSTEIILRNVDPKNPLGYEVNVRAVLGNGELFCVFDSTYFRVSN